MYKHTAIIAITLIFFTVPVVGQSIEAGAWAGGINQWSDVNTTSSVLDARPSGGILGRYNLDSRLSGKFSLNYGRATAKDKNFEPAFIYQGGRREQVRTKVLDAQAQFEFNFWDFRPKNQFQESLPWTPYFSAGVGFSDISPQLLFDNNEWVDVSTMPTEDLKDFNRGQIHIPLGAGAKYKLNERWNIGAEFTSHILFTDYFDDLSTTYNSTSVDSAGGIDQVDRQRGDRFKKDVYNHFGLQLTYVIPLDNCPTN